MRVTFLMPHASLNGGVRVCAIYAEHLRRAGHEVLAVWRPLPEFKLHVRAKEWLKGRGFNRPQGHPHHFQSTQVPCRVLERCRPIEARDLPDADVVVASWWETADWAAALPASKGAKVHLIQHDERQFPRQPIDRVAATWRLPNFRRVVVAHWLAELGQREFGVESIDVVPNGVDADFFTAPPRDRHAVLTVGLMHSNLAFKGTDIAVRGIEEARRAGLNLKVVAFGQEPIDNQHPLPTGTHYHYRPTQEQIRDAYASADVWLFTSRSEGFGLPILEAMACRTPVIGTPAGAAPELISRGGGLLVPHDDPHAIAAALMKFSQLEQHEYRSLANHARATAEANTWPQNARLFETVLLETIRDRNHAR